MFSKSSVKNCKNISAEKRVLLSIRAFSAAAFVFQFILILILIFSSGCKEETFEIKKVQEVLKKAEPQVEQTIICRSVNEDYSPLEPTNIFPQGTSSVFLSIKFSNFSPDDNLEVIWVYADAGKEIGFQEFSADTYGSGYHSFNIKIADAFVGGLYEAEVYFNGELINTLEFAVE